MSVLLIAGWPRSGSYQVGTDIGHRLDDAVHTLVTETRQPGLAIAARFAPVGFSQVQYSF